MSPWHQWGSVASPLFSSADSTADKQQVLLLQTLTAPLDTHTQSTLPWDHTLDSDTTMRPHSWHWHYHSFEMGVSDKLTVVSLYSELPPSMIMSPASRRGTCEGKWAVRRGQSTIMQVPCTTKWATLGTVWLQICTFLNFSRNLVWRITDFLLFPPPNFGKVLGKLPEILNRGAKFH